MRNLDTTKCGNGSTNSKQVPKTYAQQQQPQSNMDPNNSVDNVGLVEITEINPTTWKEQKVRREQQKGKKASRVQQKRDGEQKLVATTEDYPVIIMNVKVQIL